MINPPAKLLADTGMTFDTEGIAERLGIPKRIFSGVDQSYSAVFVQWQEKRFKKWQKKLQKEVEKKILAPIILDILNPLEFCYLLPLGKKAYCRRFPQGWKPPKIEWPEYRIHDSIVIGPPSLPSPPVG